jgi:FAD/FMN-containing dehydrogenase/Fe-S oxidoreductase
MKSMAVNVDSKLLAKRLRSLIKGEVYDDRVTRLLYSTDGSIYRHVPTVVVAPRDEADVVRLVLFAQETGVPIAPRGAGTGLAGESLTTGIMVDFTRYMTKILNCDFDAGRVTVQPGAILDDINRQALPAGWKFGPDPSSASRATVGGTLANNATGAHSLRYGYAGDNLLGLRALLADGRVLATGTDDWKELERKVFQKLNTHRRVIEKHWPGVKRNRAGYNLKGMIERNGGDLLKLFPGSEGTLSLFSEATLQLVKVPPVRLLLTANFDEFALSARATNIILEYDPAVVELMDGILIRLAREADENLARILPQSEASLMAEFDGASLEEAMGRLKQCRDRLKKEFGDHVKLVELLDPDEQKQQWAARKNAVPILFKQPGLGRPLAIVEDSAVEPAKLPEYTRGMQAIFEKFGLQATFYGHAGSGEFHIRPYMNLREPIERKKLQNLAREVYDLVWSLGGTISGEHGSGLLRSWALRKQYGQAYDLMEQVKQIFDPEKLLNPGKIIVSDTELPLDDLRADLIADTSRNQAELNHGEQTLFDLADLCNGCGECKSYDKAVLMCPIFRTLGDEYTSPRAKANLMREFLSGQITPADLNSPEVQKIVDNCLLCGNCLRECPSAVQIPRLVIELRALRRRLRGNKPVERMLVDGEYLEWIMSKFAPIPNHFLGKKGIRWAMEKFLGFDAGHGMPPFAFPGLLASLRKRAARHRPANPRLRAIWFVDLFARYHDNQLAEDIVRVCAANDIELIIPEQCGSDMPALAYGYLDQAKKAARFNIKQLSRHLSEADLVLSFEPTATLCLKEEYRMLVEDDSFDAVAEKVQDGCQFLWQLHLDGELKKGENAQPMRVGYHTPCHLRRLKCGEPGYKLLSLIDGLELGHLADNCCGLAGTFGMKAEQAELSDAIGQASARSVLEGNYEVLASECSACRMQLTHLTHMNAFHPVHFLARWYGG